MDTVVVYDTSHTTDNIGDNIIMDAVWREVEALFPEDFIITVPTHDTIGKRSRDFINKGRVGIVGGTNLLCSNWLWFRSWQVSTSDIYAIKRSPLLLGVGWLEYQRKTDFITRHLLRRLLSREGIHSVRDNYTKTRLNNVGIHNVVNTACPTMWELTEDHCAQIPLRKAKSALVTVTAYRPNKEGDLRWLKDVQSRYETVYFWSQMFADLEYVRDLLGDKVVVVPPTLKAFDDVLMNEDVDYIGTRLHGGIRALQKKRRALILEVDARSIEIARDTNLPTVKRDDHDTIVNWIENPVPVHITLPLAEIAKWRGQFGTPARAAGPAKVVPLAANM